MVYVCQLDQDYTSGTNFHSFFFGEGGVGLEFVKRIYILLDVKNLQMGGGLALRSIGSYVL